MDEARCTFRVLVANTGLADAGAFDVWLDLRYSSFRQAKTMDRLERNKEAWLSFDFTYEAYNWNGPAGNACPLTGFSYPAAAMGGDD